MLGRASKIDVSAFKLSLNCAKDMLSPLSLVKAPPLVSRRHRRGLKSLALKTAWHVDNGQ